MTPSEQEDLTYAQEFELKQPLICYSKSPSEEVVALFHEGSHMRERKVGEGSRSILVALIAATEKHDRQKQANDEQGRNSMFPKKLKEGY